MALSSPSSGSYSGPHSRCADDARGNNAGEDMDRRSASRELRNSARSSSSPSIPCPYTDVEISFAPPQHKKAVGGSRFTDRPLTA
jgi:hypothetical protein